MSEGKKPINLTESPVEVQWLEQHYLFVERVGPFMETASQCWKELHMTYLPQLKANKEISIVSYYSLYKMKPEMIYRAGVSVSAKPADLPEGLRYELVEGGKYLQYTLTGSYSGLPEACGRVFEMVKTLDVDRREAFYVEHYANSPTDTAEEELITNIMIPVK
jgi:predicted transcriptional regulator YdeE